MHPVLDRSHPISVAGEKQTISGTKWRFLEPSRSPQEPNDQPQIFPAMEWGEEGETAWIWGFDILTLYKKREVERKG